MRACLATVNAKATDGATALYLASQNGHTGIVKSLLAAGADVNSKTRAGATALAIAKQRGHAEVVKVLLASEEAAH